MVSLLQLPTPINVIIYNSLFLVPWHGQDNASSTQPVAPSDSYPAGKADTKVRWKSFCNGLMPYAKGPENYFLGEAQDAADMMIPSFMVHYCRGRVPLEFARRYVSQPQTTWALVKASQMSIPAALFFGLLTTSGIDYRRYGLGCWVNFTSLAPEAEEYFKAYEPRTEATAEKWQKVGAVIGASGALLVVNRARSAYIRPLPTFVGMTFMGASFANNISNWLA